jgi:hypothetical protein
MPDSKKHLILQADYFANPVKYEYAGPIPPSKKVTPQDRDTHSQVLLSQVSIIKKNMDAARAIQEKAQVEMDYGLLVEFESFEGIGNVFETKSITSKSDLRNIRYENNRTYATVFIPDGQLPKFEKKIQDYINYKKKINGSSNENQPLIDTIANLKKATVQALWTDTIPLPADDVIMCWEVWLAVRDDRKKQKETFIKIAESLGIEISKNCIDFRERVVFLARATKVQFEQSLELLNGIAELRKAKTAADFFVELSAQDQKEWLADLLQRIDFQNIPNTTPYICILDTGVNSVHPLLEKLITKDDIFTINDAWGKADIVSHGTNIAGLALYGDLTGLLESNDTVAITHRLESSKIINKSEYGPDTDRPLDLYAEYTQQAIAQAEIPNAHRKRIFQLAITTNDNRDKGRPSSWSSVLDLLSYGSDNQLNSRLCVVSAGNVDIAASRKAYPEINKEEGIRDPAQAWNVLTVGAYTEKDLLSDDERIDNNKPTASHGELSPYSTTSFQWDKQWPYKPDIVMEGGNTAQNPYGQAQAASLSLLTTHHNTTEKYFTTICATSAASALASRMCARIAAEYPDLRMETIRGLMIHSADWTPAMLKQFNCDIPQGKKAHSNLVRICGFGVPDIIKALTSFRNDFTMIIEDSIQPYKKAGSAVNNEMKFYVLPFPKQELETLGPVNVEMRVTLSYFIEPNPSSRGRSRYLYESHGLRFDVKTPAETEDHFKGRITKALRETDETYVNDEADQWWTLGIRNRTKGSIHSDIWRGPAAELASCNVLAIYPVGGWWKRNEDTLHNQARYSLLISIRTSVDVDLMTPVENIIDNKIKTMIILSRD